MIVFRKGVILYGVVSLSYVCTATMEERDDFFREDLAISFSTIVEN